MAIKGIDLGNTSTKSDDGLIIPAKISRFNKELVTEDCKERSIIFNDEKYFVGIGDFETCLEKAYKQYTKIALLNILARSSKDSTFDVVVGLPVGQYKKDKNYLKNDLLLNNKYKFTLDGEDRSITLNRVEVFPEGIGAFYGLPSNQREGIGTQDVIMIDVGGRTTDICLIEYQNGKRKITESTSRAVGTLDIYTDFIDTINQRYGISEDIENAEKILDGGLYIYGQKVDISFKKDIIESYVDKVFKELYMKYPIKTSAVILTGGGSCVMDQAFKRRIPHMVLHENFLLANAIGFRMVGESLWPKKF